MQQTITLTKYNNRKIYSSELSKYVNLDEILNTVKSGISIRIVEKDTGTDVTNEVLTMALVRYNPLSQEQIRNLLK